MFKFSKALMNSKPISLYGLVVPMLEEIQYILSSCECIETFKFPFFGGIYIFPCKADDEVLAFVSVQCGIGKSGVSSAVSWVCSHYNIKACFHLGTAGSLFEQLKPNDLIFANCVEYHDVDLTAFGYPIGVLPKRGNHAEKNFNILANRISFFDNFNQITKYRFASHLGGLVSGEQFICSDKIKTSIRANFPKALGVDMESAAFAQACQTYEIPWMIIRTISDHADSKNAPKDFKENVSSCAQNLYQLFFNAISLYEQNCKESET